MFSKSNLSFAMRFYQSLRSFQNDRVESLLPPEWQVGGLSACSQNDSERGIFNNRRKPIQTFYPDKQELIGVIVREVEHGICKQMNEGKDDGVGETEAPSAHPREAKARTRYGFPQRTDERSARSFIGLCVMRLPFAQAVKPQACQLLFRSFSFW